MENSKHIYNKNIYLKICVSRFVENSSSLRYIFIIKYLNGISI